MIWVTWRQHRTEAIVAGILLILFTLFLLLTGLELRRVYILGGKSGVESFAGSFPFVAIHLLPLLLGAFVGAPLISQELERGTHRLAWTQGVTSKRWFMSKMLLIAVPTLVIFLFLSRILMWWNQPINEAIGPWSTFDANGFVIIAHALFALALGTLLGAIVGKSVAAIALFVPIFPVVRLFFIWLRQYYLPPMSLHWNYMGENPFDKLGNIWLLEQSYVDRFGQLINFDLVFRTCYPKGNAFYYAHIFDPNIFSCLRENGFSIVEWYQPVERFWLFQGIETLIFLALALSLVGVTVWWLKKKGG